MLFSSLSWISVPEKNIGYEFPIASFVFTEIHIQYFFSVCYRKSNELKSKTLLGVSVRSKKCRLRMQNFNEKHPHVSENVRCRCKICEGSIFKSQKKQDVDAIVHGRQAEKYLQVRRKASCRYIGLKKSICDNEYQGSADTSVVKKASAVANKPRI